MRKQNKKRFLLFVTLWTILRLVAVITLWIWDPLWGVIFNILLDAVDGHMFEAFGVKRTTYEIYDKWLDLWFYIAIFVYTLQKLTTSPFYAILISLFIVRLIGIATYTKFKKEWLLFLFPNLLEPVFLLVVGFPQVFELWETKKIFIIVFIIKMFIEWWIHIAKLDLTSLILGKPTRWYKNKKSLIKS